MLNYLYTLRYFLLVTLLATFCRYIFAGIFPVTNDEAYYFDWSHSLQLSYFDHPPGVALVGYVSRQLFDGVLALRGLIPLIHIPASLLLWECYRLIAGLPKQDFTRESVAFAWIINLIPPLSIWGVPLLPDAGLFFASSLTLYLVLRFKEKDRLDTAHGLLLGLALGMGGLFKYHIFLVGGGLSVALALHRLWRKKIEWKFWTAAFVTGFIVCLPIFLWNYRNDFAGFVFQFNHGFTDGKFQLVTPLATVALMAILATPGIFWVMVRKFRFWGKSALAGTRLYFLLGTAPLCAVLLYSSFFKMPLPHWFYPAIWVAFPFVFTDWMRLPRWLKYMSVTVAIVILSMVPLTASVQKSGWYADNPRMHIDLLGEMLQWDDIYQSLDNQAMKQFLQTDSPDQQHCSGTRYATFRWFWSAQLNYREKYTKYSSIDQRAQSFYHYVYPVTEQPGCRMVLVGDTRHIDLAKLQNDFVFVQSEELVFPQYDNLRVQVIYARHK